VHKFDRIPACQRGRKRVEIDDFVDNAGKTQVMVLTPYGQRILGRIFGDDREEGNASNQSAEAKAETGRVGGEMSVPLIGQVSWSQPRLRSVEGKGGLIPTLRSGAGHTAKERKQDPCRRKQGVIPYLATPLKNPTAPTVCQSARRDEQEADGSGQRGIRAHIFESSPSSSCSSVGKTSNQKKGRRDGGRRGGSVSTLTWNDCYTGKVLGNAKQNMKDTKTKASLALLEPTGIKVRGIVLPESIGKMEAA